jgi:hypothetical protein
MRFAESARYDNNLDAASAAKWLTTRPHEITHGDVWAEQMVGYKWRRGTPRLQVLERASGTDNADNHVRLIGDVFAEKEVCKASSIRIYRTSS